MLDRLAVLPPLGTPPQQTRACKICGGVAPPFDVVDFQKVCSVETPYLFGLSGIPVYYHRCTACGFLFTGFCDGWSEHDFRKFIYNDDYIKVDGEYVDARPRRDAKFIATLLSSNPGLTVLDYGGGAGIFAGVLREHGFDAECYDPFSSPARPQRKFQLITSLEVLEHSSDPVGTLRDMASFLEPGGLILVGTGVQPEDIDAVRAAWWYVGPRNGHVSLQSSTSLIRLGEAAGLIAYPTGYLHGFVPSPSAFATEIVGRIGPASVELVLAAPDASGSAGWMLTSDLAGWEMIEGESRRWTTTSEIVWRWTPPLPQCDVRIRLPLLGEIEPEFLARSRLLVDGQQVPLELAPNLAKARVTLNSDAAVEIKLVTPPPPRACDVRDTPDYRNLGLYVGMVATTA